LVAAALPLVMVFDRRRQQNRGAAGPTAQSGCQPYAWVLLSLLVVLAANWIFSPHLQGRAPLVGITLPIMIGAICGGFRPALLATFLSLLVGIYIVGLRWGEPIEPYQQVQIVMFLIFGLVISWFGAKHRKIQVELAELALATEKRKDDFLAMLGHELRNPLSGISSAARLLKHAAMDARGVAENANIIHRQVAHMTHLINDLLDVSRVTRGQVQIEKTPVDLVAVMHAAVEQVGALVEHRQHRLIVDLPKQPVWMLGDNTRLVQIVTNLLVNAARYTPPHGLLTLTLLVTQDQAQISVQDNGVGIAPELAAHVFELFVQAKRSTDGVMGGLGLGLSLVKSMVDAHGGEVSLFSAGLGQGCTIRVNLPLMTAAESALTTVVKPEKKSDIVMPVPLDILVVDDNRDAAQPLAMLLQFDGHRVAVVHSGQEALQLAELDRYDAAILDIGLPDMDGYTLARRLRAMPHQSEATLIALTGYGTETDKARALDAGFDQHLVKPVDDVLLSAALKQASQRVRSHLSSAIV
jgi:signal transduction histidine kinase/CheY-like chemotaxis protein